jgi:2-polyprenyl-3-methyl-5-hydroxy-6-metoxy-1,4-benzoquinol methylase
VLSYAAPLPDDAEESEESEQLDQAEQPGEAGYVARVREVAIRHHDTMVEEFEHRYEEMARDHFGSSFAYGRQKIDDRFTAELQALAAESKVLDIGCGTGPYLGMIHAAGHKAVGLEPAEHMRVTAAMHQPSADVRDGVASALP